MNGLLAVRWWYKAHVVAITIWPLYPWSPTVPQLQGLLMGSIVWVQWSPLLVVHQGVCTHRLDRVKGLVVVQRIDV